ncbi:hypothetical protein D7W79_14505 [Corallococcus exercitus]|uniref:hypothetical protein n=1 Tax=Corallococcus exercitus TaxID=2316736 RepID=UPI000EA1A77D|nr:hypothetical protein [Corallococcus exercitus]RKG77756.1 hypothetical protein D7W79_14505 [Corallococcus exercitus]
MLRSLLVAVVALTAGCRAHSSATQAPSTPAAPQAASSYQGVPDEELLRVQKRARYIATSERGAISASDLLVQRPDLDHGKLNCFFTVPRGNAWYSVFGKVDEQGAFVPVYAYRAPIEFSEQMEALPVESLPEGLDAVARAVSASTTRTAEVHGRGQLNPVVVEEDGGITVYVLQGFNDPKVYLLGGDIRFRFSQDGRRKVEETLLHQGIIPVEVGSSLDGKRQHAASVHEHLLIKGPLETELALTMLYPAMGSVFVSSVGVDALYNLRTDGTIRVIGGEPADVQRELRPDGTFAPLETAATGKTDAKP